MYYLRSASLREFFLDCLTIGKIVVASLLFFAKFKLCFMYIGVCLLSWIVSSYPKYKGRNNFIKIKSEEQFDELVGPIVESRTDKEVNDYQPYQYRNKKMFFIEFYADWLSLCHTVSLSIVRVKNYGTNIPTDTRLLSSSSCKSMLPISQNWRRGSI